MNVQQLVAAAVVFAAAGSAMAQQGKDGSEFTNTPSTASRTAVKAEVASPATGKTRAEVRTEIEQAYKNHQLAANRNTESVEFPNVASTKTRAEVRNEVIQSTKASH